MKISIALCTYNGEKFLSEQLNSFLTQTVLPDELIICDDLSNDSTPKIVAEFAEKAPFQVQFLVNEKNLGSTKNFERAISFCTGEIIFLSDQDDFWFSEKIETITNEFKQNSEIGMVFTDAELVNENLKSLQKKLCDLTYQKSERNSNFFDILLKRNVVTGATMAFRKEFVEKFTPIPTEIPNTIHDAWISLVIAANSDVKFIEKSLIKYRQHANQQIGVDWQFKSRKRDESYQKSIAFHHKEIERLHYMRSFFQQFAYFQTKNYEKLIDQNLLEKENLIKHYEARLNLAENKLKRIPMIFAQLKNGNYAKFSNGWKSAAKDLIGKFDADK
jgi:glycosyltransferase involved in cell wall biosynthesis